MLNSGARPPASLIEELWSEGFFSARDTGSIRINYKQHTHEWCWRNAYGQFADEDTEDDADDEIKRCGKDEEKTIDRLDD